MNLGGCLVEIYRADSDLEVISLPLETPATRFWSARRRVALLIAIVIGLLLSLVWLPGEAWPALFAALRVRGTLVAMLLFLALIAVSLVWSAGQRLDTSVSLFFNLCGYHSKWLDRVMWLATQAGNMVTAFVLAGLLFLPDVRRMAAEVLLGTLTLWLIVEIIKAVTDRARPFLDLGEARVIGWRERGKSFPSGHTAQTFFLATLLSQMLKLGAGITVALFAVALLVGFTRMYVGAHYPRDVIGGAVLGCVRGILATLVDPLWLGIWF
jgi:membrane-associated phospholipid phosphatase